ncbi:long-subunit fatty acid transport protein [Bradyrhizobium sp. GM2.2]|jgi:hypothetical protein|uniref:hypothetical protein n=1 Tax=Bradyrhizobium TaxID=374 RepID=UPI0003731ADA|nr:MULTISPECIES: hypothetical protein [unclassified Bradyrhizobium]MCK1271744.1 hypothetical protein [Bradyrhizobium sp. 84]MCK1304234.1 hypothetical protein [Bradyrhizobium sp. 45]MCK1318870.1 hypothetical protein [Bradyrhizobium sp. 23]MCK1319383.1 hypothetical protein [Bradyrhizobium sp. 156]MCK1329006.1 hypothetical protein [Bradyrhizobium sp. CW9]
MRKIILVTAMVLVSASAQAGGPRSLSLSAVSEPASVQQTTPALAAAPTQVSEAAPAAEAPKYLDRPPAVSLNAPAAVATPTTTTASAPATTTQPAAKTTAKADKPKHKRSWTEGRIISELHRHGIYW